MTEAATLFPLDGLFQDPQLTPRPDAPRFTVQHGSCFDLFKRYGDNYFHALVTDPPAGISFGGEKWDNLSKHAAETARGKELTPLLAQMVTFEMLEKWEAGFLLFTVDWAVEALRTLRPGAHGLVWAIPRTSDLTKFGLRMAGFEIRDTIYHAQASGMPKSLDIGKSIDKNLGLEREIVGRYQPPSGKPWNLKDDTVESGYDGGFKRRSNSLNVTTPSSDEAKHWDGWGTGLKPMIEEWIMIRKPIVGTVIENVAAHGVGGININGCRVPITDGALMARVNRVGENGYKNSKGGPNNAALHGEPYGRYPGNFTHDGSEEVVAEFPYTKSGAMKAGQKRVKTLGQGGYSGGMPDVVSARGTIANEGSAARFFYCAKVTNFDKDEGLAPGENTHQTVKPEALMRYLVRLITPPKGNVLDPFTGSGSTGKACMLEGFDFDGFERDEKSVLVARKRIEHARSRAGV